jgi:hypothetical protein
VKKLIAASFLLMLALASMSCDDGKGKTSIIPPAADSIAAPDSASADTLAAIIA